MTDTENDYVVALVRNLGAIYFRPMRESETRIYYGAVKITQRPMHRLPGTGQRDRQSYVFKSAVIAQSVTRVQAERIVLAYEEYEDKRQAALLDYTQIVTSLTETRKIKVAEIVGELA